jgi:hypothetical protein
LYKTNQVSNTNLFSTCCFEAAAGSAICQTEKSNNFKVNWLPQIKYHHHLLIEDSKYYSCRRNCLIPGMLLEQFLLVQESAFKNTYYCTEYVTTLLHARKFSGKFHLLHARKFSGKFHGCVLVVMLQHYFLSGLT